MTAITVYRGARDPTPVDAQDLPWDTIATELEALANEPSAAPEGAHPEVQKRRMVAWAPHALMPGTTRSNASVDHVSMLVVDVDNDDRPEAPVTPEAIATRLHEHGIASLLYESARSTPVLPKFRVVVPITTPIAPGDCADTRGRFAEWLGLGPKCGVNTAKDESKLFFSGRLHGTPPRRVWRTDGVHVNPEALPANSGAWVAAYTSAPAATSAPPLAELPPANAGIVAALGDWRAHPGRKWALCGAVGGLMRRLAYTRFQCEAVIRAWLPPNDPNVNVEAGVEWALGAWRHAPEDVSGIDAVAELVGLEHADVIERAAISTAFPVRCPQRPKTSATSGAAWRVVTSGGDALGVDIDLATEYGPIPYECAGLCLAPSRGKISIIGGEAGHGKGPIADYLAVCFALGVPVFGRWPVTRQPVLVLDVEGARLTQRRMRRFCRALGRDPAELRGWITLRDVSSVSLMDEHTMRLIDEHPARIVIVDSYTSAMLRYDVDPYKNEFARLATMLAQLDRTVIVVAHSRKPSAGKTGERPTLADISGSGALGAMAQTAISVWRPDIDHYDRVKVACARAPEQAFEGFEIEFSDTENGDGLAIRQVTAQEAARAEKRAENVSLELACNEVLRWFQRKGSHEWCTVKDVAKTLTVASDGGRLIREPIAQNAIALLGGHEFLAAGSKIKDNPSYTISPLGRTTKAVAIEPSGELVRADEGFRRPE